ncbi:MAG: hypothetical protein NTW33_00455 [Methanoregula sp.]|nr:hypothetical protein [Methanoregula sp.]
MSDIKDGSKFSLLVEGRFDVPPGAKFSFETNNFNMPISLSDGAISAYTENTQSTRFAVKKGEQEVVYSNIADENGVFTFTKSQDIGSGIYDYLTIGGTSRTDKNNIVARFQLTGNKSGPATSDITFNVGGIDNGRLILTVFIDAAAVMEGYPITIGNPTFVTVVPTLTPTPTPTGEIITGSADSPNPGITPTIQNVNHVFTSVDGKVLLTTTKVDYAGILPVTISNLPDDWLAITDAYAISPSTLTFEPAADLSFTFPTKTGSIPYNTYFMGQYQNGKWIVVPSISANNVVKIKINASGTYALMALKPISSTTSTGSSTPTASASQQAVTTSGTPGITPITKAADTPAKPTPLSIIPIIGAGLLCILIYKRSKK